jgi:hypothetical protein
VRRFNSPKSNFDSDGVVHTRFFDIGYRKADLLFLKRTIAFLLDVLLFEKEDADRLKKLL